jgi:hypothetical protein
MLGATATLDENVVRGGPSLSGWVTITSGFADVTDNTLQDTAPTPSGDAISSYSTGTVTITGNQISGFISGVEVRDGVAQVAENRITGLRSFGGNSGRGIESSDSALTATHNTIIGNATDLPGNDGFGILIDDFTGPAPPTGILRRNSVDVPGIGIYLSDSASATLEGDYVKANTGLFQLDEVGGTSNGGNATATNVTIEAPPTGFAASVNEATLTLNSSIVAGPILGPAGPTCTISFSRGDTQVPGANGCQNFQSSANPMLTAAGDPHLQAGSPMIDAGDPASPPAGTLDLDGDPRQIDGDGDGIARRDIGADERLSAPPVSSSGPPQPESGPPPVKKCGKKKRLKKGKCVKKKRKKRK